MSFLILALLGTQRPPPPVFPDPRLEYGVTPTEQRRTVQWRCGGNGPSWSITVRETELPAQDRRRRFLIVLEALTRDGAPVAGPARDAVRAAVGELGAVTTLAGRCRSGAAELLLRGAFQRPGTGAWRLVRYEIALAGPEFINPYSGERTHVRRADEGAAPIRL